MKNAANDAGVDTFQRNFDGQVKELVRCNNNKGSEIATRREVVKCE